MSSLWTNTTTGAIVIPNPGQNALPLGIVAIEWTNEDTPSLSTILDNPQRYLYSGDTVVAQPYWATTQATTSGTTTITGTLNNPPSTPPTSATVTVGTTTLSVPVSSNTATIAVTLHETLAGFSVPVQVSASGTVTGTVTVGAGGKPPVALQAIAPTTSGDPYVIGPTGTEAKTFCRQVAMGLTPETEMEILTLSAQNLFLTASMVADTLINKILPWAQQSTWSALTLTSEESAAITAFTTNLTPYLPGLGDMVTTSGDPAIPQVAEMYAQAPALQTAAANYATWIAELGL